MTRDTSNTGSYVTCPRCGTTYDCRAWVWEYTTKHHDEHGREIVTQHREPLSTCPVCAQMGARRTYL